MQPLDVGVSKSFKNKIQNLWEKFMTKRQYNYIKNGKMYHASYAKICEYIKWSWNEISQKTIKNAFKKAKISDEIDYECVDKFSRW